MPSVGIFNRLKPCKVLVLGDLLLDIYTIGKARRLSPEAPVAIVHVSHEENRPGGSGNVALNLTSLGAEVVLAGRVGADAAGENLSKALRAEKISLKGVVVQDNFKTPIKKRIIAENQQIVRVDYEEVTPLSKLLEQQLCDSLCELLEEIDVVAISDYGKGFLSRQLLAFTIEKANQKKIPIIADPKGIDFSKYSGSTILKPNLSEVIAASGLTAEMPLEQICSKVLSHTSVDTLMVTRAEAGITLFHRDGTRQDFSVRAREVKDVTGAGDTVLAVLSYAIANKIGIAEATQLANVAAGMAIERLGCARISLAELASHLLETDLVNKIFDAEHLFALQEVLKGKSCAVVAIKALNHLTPQLFSHLRHLSLHCNYHVIAYLCDPTPCSGFISLLASLREVSFIMTSQESVRILDELIKPNEVYLFENECLKKVEDFSWFDSNQLSSNGIVKEHASIGEFDVRRGQSEPSLCS